MFQIVRVGGVVKITENNDTYVEGEFPPNLENYYEHYSECYKHCLLLESTLTSLETATGHPCFPVIIGRRPNTGLSDSPCQGKENFSPTGINGFSRVSITRTSFPYFNIKLINLFFLFDCFSYLRLTLHAPSSRR